MNDLSIRDVIAILKKNFLWVIIFTLIFNLIGIFISIFFIPNIYESSSLMYISANNNSIVEQSLTYSDYELNLKLSETYRELCKTKKVLDKVVEETNINYSYDDLSKRIAVNNVNDTEIIEIVVHDQNPEIAAELANAIAKVFITDIPDIVMIDNVKIIDYATIPTKPIKPNILINTIVMGLIGFFGIVSFIFSIDMLDYTIRDRKQLENILGKPVYGVIPKVESINREFKQINSGKFQSKSLSESFVRFASNIEFLKLNTKLGTSLIITSPVTPEGKSFINSNLAIALSQSNNRVLLIDADMRRPLIHKFFKLSNEAGLSTLLSTNDSMNSYLKQSNISNLQIITSGPNPPNPGMLLSSQKMKDIISVAKNDFDYIIIDSSPVLQTSDIFSLWSSQIDNFLLVVKYKSTTRHNILNTKEDLERINVQITGAILNEY